MDKKDLTIINISKEIYDRHIADMLNYNEEMEVSRIENIPTSILLRIIRFFMLEDNDFLWRLSHASNIIYDIAKKKLIDLFSGSRNLKDYCISSGTIKKTNQYTYRITFYHYIEPRNYCILDQYDNIIKIENCDNEHMNRYQFNTKVDTNMEELSSTRYSNKPRLLSPSNSNDFPIIYTKQDAERYSNALNILYNKYGKEYRMVDISDINDSIRKISAIHAYVIVSDHQRRYLSVEKDELVEGVKFKIVDKIRKENSAEYIEEHFGLSQEDIKQLFPAIRLILFETIPINSVLEVVEYNLLEWGDNL